MRNPAGNVTKTDFGALARRRTAGGESSLGVALSVCIWAGLMAGWLATTGISASAAEGWKPDRILVTFWSPPPATDEALAVLARDHYNLTWTPESGLDAAERHGLKVMLQDALLTPTSLDDPAQRRKLEALIDRVKDRPALEAYFLVDEPSAGAFPALGRLVAFLRERDRAHLAYINLFPTYANNTQLGTPGDTATAYRDHLRLYLEEVRPALISYDHYPFFRGRDGDQYFLNLGMIREASLSAGVPFLNIIQACTIEKSWRLVNADEMRFMVYTTLAYGGRGISYFLYWGPAAYGGLYQDGVRTPLADVVAALNREIESLSPVLMKLESLGVYHSGSLPRGTQAIPESCPVRIENGADCVVGLFGAGSRSEDFMLVNRSYRTETPVRVRVPAEARTCEEWDRNTKGWRGVPGWQRTLPWTVTLAPGDGRLFRWSTKP